MAGFASIPDITSLLDLPRNTVWAPKWQYYEGT